MRRTLIIAVVITLGGASYLLGWSEMLPVKKVTISESEKSIVAELTAKLEESPKAIEIGKPIARVDKRVITRRLQSLIWVDAVEVRRNFFSGEVTISVSPRSALARISGKNFTSDLAFLGSNLEIFYVSRSAVEKAAKTGDVDWLALPTLDLGSTDLGLRKDVKTIIAEVSDAGGKISEIRAPGRDSLSTRIRIRERELDISWGSVNELPLKFQVLDRLLNLKANRNVKRIDLSSPLTPIVANSLP